MTPLFAEEWQVQAVAPFRALDKLARRQELLGSVLREFRNSHDCTALLIDRAE